MARPVVGFHKRVVPSAEAVTMYLLLGDQATEYTMPVWPVRTVVIPLIRSQMRTVRSTLAVARR
jgi:hypothetical protein